ncbi:MAG: sigma 54-interacting transcriptional regulator [Kofleriaceae bacterium]
MPGAAPPTSVLARLRELRIARYRLVVTEGPDRGLSIDGAEQDLAIGTAPANDLVLTDSAVSRHHIELARTPRGAAIRDLGSTNGTLVDGVPVERAYLVPNATISIGNTRLRFEALADETRAPLSNDDRFGRALGASPAMRRIFALLPRLAESDATILLEGETGTGKGLLATAIHEASGRATGPMTVVDCGAIPPSLIETELFGHEKGAFTGATAARAGAFESAHGGTVFLDEIGELPLDMQAKLLRALEERVVKRVGGNDPIALDIRVIAATNRDLRSEVNRGRFRSDLYYRLGTLRLRIPPLRERREDIALLVSHFYGQIGSGEPPAELLAELVREDWPGNVRELRATVERAVLLGDREVWHELTGEAPRSASAEPLDHELDLDVSFRVAKERAVGAWEREYVRALVDRHAGNLSRAARAVRMDRNHLRELLIRHRVRVDDS